MKRVLFIILACFMTASSFGFEITKTGYKMNFTITSSTNNEVKLTSVSNTSSSVVDLYDIPETVEYEGVMYTVTRICEDALQSGKYETVIIPKTITVLERQICTGIPDDATGWINYGSCRTFNTLYYKAVSASATEGPFAPNFRNLVIEDGVVDIPPQLTYGYYMYQRPGSTAIFTAQKGNSLIQSLSFPNSVKTIGSKAFYECGTEDVSFGCNIRSIGTYAFASCKNLKSIKFPKTINTISNNAFYSCRSLRTIEFMETVGPVIIGNNAFSNCDSLRTIKLARNIISIGTGAFSGCKVLENVYNYCPIPVVISEGTFNNKPTSAVLHVPKGTADLYRAATEWNTFIIIDDLDVDNSNYNDENGEIVSSSTFIEVNGVLWAKGNLQYNRNDGDPNFYDNNFRIAPAQWHYFGYDDEDFNVGDTCVMSSTQIDYFNWAVTGSNASVYTQYSTITDKNVQCKMFTNADGSDETTNFSESKYGDLAYWASGGVYQYPSYQDFDKLRHAAVRSIKYYKTESGKEIKGLFFSDINKQYGKYLTDNDLRLGVFLPLIGYRKGQSTDVYQREEWGYYQCIAQDSLGNQQFLMYPQNGTNQYVITYYNPRQYMRIGFPIRPVLAANTSTLAGTSNGGGRITIDDKTYNDEYFRHHLFEMNGPAAVAIHPSSSFNAMVFYNGELQESLTSIDYTTKSQVDSLMVIFYSNNELISWQTDRYLKDDFSPQWRNNAIGYEVTADISGLDSSIGKHNAVIPFTFAKDGFQAVININYSYEVIDGITVFESDYKVYTDNPVIFCTAHQPVSIPIYMKNAEEVTGIELPFYVDGMSFTGTEEDLLLGAADDWSSYLQLAERASGLTAQEGAFRVFQDSVQRMSGADIIMNASESILGNDGLLLTVVMVPPKSGVFSSHEITSPIILHLVDESQVELEPIGLKIVAERLPGDNNDDGVVDANDQLGGNVYNINLGSGNVALGIVNETSSVPVRVQNTEAVTSFAVTLSLPERIELVDDVDTFIEATERGAGFTFSATQNDDGTITITGTSSTPLEAGEGPVLNLKVKTAWQNTYTIPVTNMTVTTANGDIKQLPDSETRLVMQGVRGDMNGDGRVDLSDALYIINLATGQAE